MSAEKNLSIPCAVLTPEQQESFKEAAKPLMAWMASNIHPNSLTIVCSDPATLHEGLHRITHEFLEV